MTCPQCGCIITEQEVRFCPQCGTKLQQDPPIAQNTAEFAHDLTRVWPEWQIVKQLGRGAFGVVYQSVRKDHNLESHAAIKVISIPSDTSEIDTLRAEGLDETGTQTYFRGIVDDFVSEIQLMESLKGIQNIVSVEDYKVVPKSDSIGWDIYIRMELLTPFNSYICDKNLTEDDVIKLGCDICTALEICDKRRIIHRDIKPENIFINDFGHFKLGDFGIARKLENATGGLSQKGTLSYMAPEVTTGNSYDARVDTYSLGIVLYRLLNGNRLPFLSNKQLPNPNERRTAVERRLRGEMLPIPCNASTNMGNLILRACAFDPAKRFASATEMKNALLAVKNGTYVPVLIDTSSAFSTDTQQDENTVSLFSDTPAETDNHVVDEKLHDNKDGTSEDTPKKKSKKGMIIAITILSSIVVLALILVILFFTSPAYRVKASMEDGKYSLALSDFRSDVRDNFIQKALLDMLISGQADEVVAAYNAGDMEFDSAQQALNALNSMGYNDAADKLKQVMTSHADKLIASYKSKKSDYNTAVGVLKTMKTDGFEKADSYIAQLTELYAKDIVIQYNTDSINYTVALNILKELKKDGYKNADSMINQLVTSEESNQALKKGNEYYKDGNYENAISEYTKIPESDRNYEEAQKMLNAVYTAYIDATVKTIDQYMTQKNYKNAVQYANAAYDILPDDIDTSKLDTKKGAALTAYRTDISNTVTKLTSESNYSQAFAVINEAISFDNSEYFYTLKTATESNYITLITNTVSNFEKNKDYASAIKTIAEADPIVSSDPDFTDKLNNLKDSYRQQVIGDADNALKTKGYKEAIRFIESGLEVLPNDAKLLAKITEYEEYKPVSIADLEYFTGHDFGFGHNLKDNLGNIHNNVTFPVCQGWSNATTTNVYKLNKQYTKLTGTWFQFYECRTSNMPHSDYKGDLEIYGDGVLLFIGEMGPGIEPIQLNIDISGVSELKIFYFGGGSKGTASGIADFNVQK